MVGFWSIAGGVGLAVLDIEYGIDDVAVIQYYTEKPKRAKIKYDKDDRAYITFARQRYYLDECMRV